MLRVRETVAGKAGPVGGAGRMAAMAALGVALGAAATIGATALVQAEDDAGIRAFHRQEAAASRSSDARSLRATSAAYAPAAGAWRMPLFDTRADGRIAHPPVALNPFAKRPQPRTSGPREAARTPTLPVSNLPRTICVRLCDGFHAPIGLLRAKGDIRAHEALCEAANPGIPVKVFHVAAGATDIDDAISVDGRSTYRALPMARAHERASDAACRPAVVAEGERRVSLLRDITLRPGDSVVLDGRVTTFAGSARWPYSARDFRDFRASRDLNARDRRAIDVTVGVSHREAQMRSLRRQLSVRQAALPGDGHELGLRGRLDPKAGDAARVVKASPYR